MAHEMQLATLKVYADYAEKLQSDAEASGRWLSGGTCDDIDDNELYELQSILSKAAEDIRTALWFKVSELQDDVSDEELDNYGLLQYRNA